VIAALHKQTTFVLCLEHVRLALSHPRCKVVLNCHQQLLKLFMVH